MSLDAGRARIHALVRRWTLMRAGGACLAIAASVALGWAFAGRVSAPAALAMSLAVAFGACFWLARGSGAGPVQVARHLDRSAPSLEESAELILADPERLAPLERLQQARIAERLERLAQVRIPITPLRRGAAVAVAIAAIALLSLLVPARAARPEHPAAGREIASGLPVLGGIEVTVRPPAYTGLPPRTGTPDLEVESGALVTWRAQANARARGAGSPAGRHVVASPSRRSLDGGAGGGDARGLPAHRRECRRPVQRSVAPTGRAPGPAAGARARSPDRSNDARARRDAADRRQRACVGRLRYRGELSPRHRGQRRRRAGQVPRAPAPSPDDHDRLHPLAHSPRDGGPRRARPGAGRRGLPDGRRPRRQAPRPAGGPIGDGHRRGRRYLRGRAGRLRGPATAAPAGGAPQPAADHPRHRATPSRPPPHRPGRVPVPLGRDRPGPAPAPSPLCRAARRGDGGGRRAGARARHRGERHAACRPRSSAG